SFSSALAFVTKKKTAKNKPTQLRTAVTYQKGGSVTTLVRRTLSLGAVLAEGVAAGLSTIRTEGCGVVTELTTVCVGEGVGAGSGAIDAAALGAATGAIVVDRVPAQIAPAPMTAIATAANGQSDRLGGGGSGSFGADGTARM